MGYGEPVMFWLWLSLEFLAELTSGPAGLGLAALPCAPATLSLVSDVS